MVVVYNISYIKSREVYMVDKYFPDSYRAYPYKEARLLGFARYFSNWTSTPKQIFSYLRSVAQRTLGSCTYKIFIFE